MTPARENINELLDRIEQLPYIRNRMGKKCPVCDLNDPRAMLSLAAELAPVVGRWQLQVSNALASAHSHGWAVQPADFGKEFGDAEEFQIVDVFERAIPRIDTCGIRYPRVDNNGAIVHTTDSGRLTWTVGRDELVLEVSRPAGDAFTITVCEGIRWQLHVYIGGEVPFHRYHVETARVALRAVVEEGLLPEQLVSDESFAELLGRALPDPIKVQLAEAEVELSGGGMSADDIVADE